MTTNPNLKHQSFFHTTHIKKGVYGELSKIKEELDEAFDAQHQGQELMMLIELADIVGAVEGVSNKYGFTIEQLLKFARLRSDVAVKELNLDAKNNLVTPVECEVIEVVNVTGKGVVLCCNVRGVIKTDDILLTEDNEHIDIKAIELSHITDEVGIIVNYDFVKAGKLVGTILTIR